MFNNTKRHENKKKILLILQNEYYLYRKSLVSKLKKKTNKFIELSSIIAN